MVIMRLLELTADHGQIEQMRAALHLGKDMLRRVAQGGVGRVLKVHRGMKANRLRQSLLQRICSASPATCTRP